MTPNNYPEVLDELAVKCAARFGINYIPADDMPDFARALLDALAERGYVLVDAKKQEPVGWVDDSGLVFWEDGAPPDGSDLYTHPAIPGRVALPDGWIAEGLVNDIKFKDQEIAELRAKKFARFRNEDCWIYQGDGEDHLESLVCPVVISPQALMELVSAANAAPATTPQTQPQGDGRLRRSSERYELAGYEWVHPEKGMQLTREEPPEHEEAYEIRPVFVRIDAAMEASNGNA